MPHTKLKWLKALCDFHFSIFCPFFVMCVKALSLSLSPSPCFCVYFPQKYRKREQVSALQNFMFEILHAHSLSFRFLLPFVLFALPSISFRIILFFCHIFYAAAVIPTRQLYISYNV